MFTQTEAIQSLQHSVAGLVLVTGIMAVVLFVMLLVILIYAAMISRIRYRLKKVELYVNVLKTSAGLQK